MAKMRVAGSKDESFLPLSDEISEALGEVRVRAALKVAAERSDQIPQEIEVDDDDLIELEFEGGIRQFIRAREFRADYALPTSRDADDTIVVPTRLGSSEQQRGIVGDFILKKFRVLGLPLEGIAASAVASHFESKIEAGLHRWSTNELGPTVENLDNPAGDEPILIFLHGTASSTVGSFGGLAEQPDVWQGLQEKYAGRVYGFEHSTLTKSPAENVLDLLRAIPHGAQLHLVSHSRGGLLGELLCRSFVERGEGHCHDPFDALDLEQFEGDAYEHERGILSELNRVLVERRPRVTRFVRVACPAAGTILASARLDRYFSLLVNLVGKVTGAGPNPMYDFVTSMAMATARERSDPQTLPGLEAMNPESPLVRVINRPDARVDADLSVVAGDIEGAGFWQALKVFAADLFYWQQHDLVVHTKAMYGGTPRDGGARYFFDRGGHVSHFNYFKNSDSTQKLVAALGRSGDKVAGFRSLEPGTEPVLRRSVRSKSVAPRGVVYVLPGIMGSQLSVRGDKVWVDPFGLVRGHLAKLAIDADGVEATGVIRSAYGQLVDYLAEQYDVVTFPYDWRRSLREEARRLAGEIEAKLNETPLPVRLVAHSMGGLLARAMIAERDDVWNQIAQRGGRLVQLGTPNLGSFGIANVLLGRDSLLRNLARIDFRHNRQEVLDIIRRFPGVLELLPMDTAGGDYFTSEQWQILHGAYGEDWHMPNDSDLRTAGRLRKLLEDPRTIDPERMSYVAGRAAETPVNIRVDRTRKKAKRIIVEGTDQGDGRVPWATGIPPGVNTWYADVVHGDLADHRPIFPAILELMERGSTQRLPTSPPVSRGATRTFEMRADESPYFPTIEDLEASAIGRIPGMRQEDVSRKIAVRVTHGDLRYARHPVLIGHYGGDTIVGAERVLDGCVGGRLRERYDLALYPGDIESCTSILDDGSHPRGAIVVGLGRIGELAPGDLRRTLTKGLLSYCLEVVEARSDVSYHGLTVTSLLVGSGEGGVSIRDSVVAVIDAARQANRALSRTRLSERVRIQEVELLEMHLDRAARAAKVLHALGVDGEYSRSFDLSEWRVGSSRGGTSRIAYEHDADWWGRVAITERRFDGALRFVNLTDRARAESRLLATERTSLDSLLRDAVQTTRFDPRLSRTLFELLYPNPLKDAAPQERNTVLVVDQESARYPWELLQDSLEAGTKPLAVRAGLVRQMQTWSFREKVGATAASRVFVVGDPPTETFARLDGAKIEADSVRAVFDQAGFEVEAAIRTGFREILMGLFDQRGYRVLHLAGHGVYEYEPQPDPDDRSDCNEAPCRKHRKKPKPVTGMVLGDDVFLTPAHVEQMRVVPELVFINCCHLGREEGNRRNGDCDRFHQLAANLGTQLIQMGARAVIAAGWAVDDEAARLFAETFYSRMLEGIPFGEAVRAARSLLFEKHGDLNTWGAYQCYGDPAYILASASSERDASQGEILSVLEEAIVSLANFSKATSTQPLSKMKAERAKLKELTGQIPESWKRDARLLTALGSAYGQVGLFDKAVAAYDRAREAEDALLSIKAIEQSANLRCRWAASLVRKGASRKQRAEAVKIVSSAVSDLETLIKIGKTKERFALLGGARKRQALVMTGSQRIHAVKQMLEGYQAAHELAIDRDGRLDHHPTLQWLTARVLLGLHDHKEGLEDVESWLDRVERAILESEGADVSFWGAVAQIDCDLARCLFQGGLDRDDATDLARRYLEQAVRGSFRQFSSVLEHLEFLTEMLESIGAQKKVAKGSRDEARRLGKQIDDLRGQLEAALGVGNYSEE